MHQPLLKLAIVCSFFTINSLNTTAQNNSDCITALDACSKENISINYENSNGMIEENITTNCDILFDTEFSPTWLKYSFVKAGMFTFDIIPTNENDDIDFVVYKSPSNDCDNLESIRCMFSGETKGQDNFCLGSTGLSLESTDFNEAPGCQDGSDNYVAALDVEIGDIIYVLIISFNQEFNTQYEIQHGGTAETNCTTLSNNTTVAPEGIKVYPNPFKSAIYFTNLESIQQGGVIEILDISGRALQTLNTENLNKINLEKLNPGIYLVKYINKQGLSTVQKILKI